MTFAVTRHGVGVVMNDRSSRVAGWEGGVREKLCVGARLMLRVWKRTLLAHCVIWARGGAAVQYVELRRLCRAKAGDTVADRLRQ